MFIDDPLCEIEGALPRLISEPTYDKESFWAAEWTPRIKNILADIGFHRGHSVWASGLTERDNGQARVINQEWLFDLIWIDYCGRGVTRHFKAMPLAAESEMGPWHEVIDDFEKLLVTATDNKVMLFHAKDAEDAVKRCDELTEIEAAFEGPRTRSEYLLACLAWKDGRFVIRRFPSTERKK